MSSGHNITWFIITSVASFLVWGGGGQDPQMYRQKKVLTCASERSERAPLKYIFLGLQIHLYVHNAVPFHYLWHSAVYTLSWQNTNIEYASELRNFLAFSHCKTAISFYILLVLLILCLRNIYIFMSQITPAGSFLLLLMVWRYINASIPTKH